MSADGKQTRSHAISKEGGQFFTVQMICDLNNDKILEPEIRKTHVMGNLSFREEL